MDSETWLDKAARLQRALAPIREHDDEVRESAERIKLALWLRREFSDETDAPNVVAFVPEE